MRRFTLSFLLLIGVGLIAAPLALSMFPRANNGAQMVNAFRPIMQPANVQTTADYYYSVFTKLRPIALAMNAQTVAKFENYLNGMKAIDPKIAKQIPGLRQMAKDLGGLLGLMSANVAVFAQVPAGLDHYKPLVDTMRANVGNYSSVDAMPRMTLFPWFFLVPGILIVLAAGYLLLADWRPQALGSFKLPRPTPLPH